MGLEDPEHRPPNKIGEIDGGNHLHFIDGPGVGGGTLPGDFNALTGLDGYSDDAPPMISPGSLAFCQDVDRSNTMRENSCMGSFPVDGLGRVALRGDIDARIQAKDFCTLSGGGACSAGSRTGVYVLGYRVLDSNGTCVADHSNQVEFLINPATTAEGMSFVQPQPAPGRQDNNYYPPFYYWVTNEKPAHGTSATDSSWRTKRMCAGCPDALDIFEAEYPDGRYTFEACVGDIANSVCTSSAIVVDNFKPRIIDLLLTGPGSSSDQVAKIGDTVNVVIRFDQEMDDLVLPTFQIAETQQALAIESSGWAQSMVAGRVVSELSATLKLPELESQQNIATRLRVIDAKGLGPAGRDVMAPQEVIQAIHSPFYDNDVPLQIHADLVRPKPVATWWEGPAYQCGRLDIQFAVTDEPEFHRGSAATKKVGPRWS